MNILMVHDGDKTVKGKIKKEIIVRDCYYKQVLGEGFAKASVLAQFDYILLTVENDSLIATVTQKIKDLDVAEEKILIYKYYEKNLRDKNLIEVNRFLHSSDQYEGLIVGMSHTQNGIRAECFDNKLLKLGVPSVDLYYMKKLIEILAAAQKLSHCSYIIIEIPYYIFNWDISKADRKVYERYSLLHYFNDYHHFTETETSRKYLHKMHIMDTMMEEKLLTYYSQNRRDNLVSLGNNVEFHDYILFDIISAFYHCVMQESREQRFLKRQACEQEYGIWKNEHNKTIYENKEIWKDIVQLIKNETKSANIFLTIFPHNPYFIKCHRDSVRKMRRIFYKVIGKDENITVIDHFKCFRRQQYCFLDECHLNDFGAYIYSVYLRKELKRLGCAGI